jgi:arabinose-5-phosphate isomerase
LPPFSEACYLGLAPTSSTTVEMCYGDALAVAASEIYGFSKTDFGKFHPAGSLGKRLILKVSDLMASGKNNSLITEEEPLLDAINEISKKGLGIVTVTGQDGGVAGIITDGDLRRLLEKKVDIYNMKVKDVMNRAPVIIESRKMAIDALTIMKEKNVSCLPVVFNGKCVGTIRLQSIVNAGIVG